VAQEHGDAKVVILRVEMKYGRSQLPPENCSKYIVEICAFWRRTLKRFQIMGRSLKGRDNSEQQQADPE